MKEAEILRDVAEAAMSCLDEGSESAMTSTILPVGMRRFYRTSNHIERLNKELKRRSKVIGVFPNEDFMLRFMGSVLIERHEAAQNGKAVFCKENYEALLKSETPLRLAELAEEQHHICWQLGQVAQTCQPALYGRQGL